MSSSPVAQSPAVRHDAALRAAAALLLLGVLVGLLLRWGQVVAVPGLDAGRATHSHSHTLFFGWAGLALFALFFERVAARDAAVRGALASLAVLGAVTLVVFFVWGYERPGIVVSALSLLPYGATVALFLRRARGHQGADLPLLRAGAVFVLLSYVAAIGRVVLKVAQVEDPRWGLAAVHLFLGTFMAFLVVGALGLSARALAPQGQPLPPLVARLVVPLAPWPALAVVASLEGTPLGALGRVAAVLLLLPAGSWLAFAWRASAGHAALERLAWRSVALAWLAAALAPAALVLEPLRAVAANRHAVVLGIHLSMVGVVSASLLALLARRAGSGFGPVLAQQAGLGVMGAGLAWAALAPARAPLVLAAVGGSLVVLAQAWAAVGLARGAPPSAG